jgi:hypothetical protein
MSFTCAKCSYTTDRKLNYDRHCESDKHKMKVSPLAQQLHELKIKEMELKTETKMKEYEQKAEIKRAEMEQKQELKVKEMELKQQIKDELLKTEDKVVSRANLEKVIPLITLMERVIDRSTLEDYLNVFNGAATFQDIFLRDFRMEYAENKSIVVDKGGKTGYYMNNAPCLWMFYTDDKMSNPIKRVFSLIPLYHKYLKDFAKENGCNIKHFNLSLDVIAELESAILDEITYRVCF